MRGGSYGPSPIISMSQLANTKQPSAPHGSKHKVMLPTSKLNSSDFHVLGGRYLLLPLQERVTPALFKNVMKQGLLARL
jgi:hypothetical protein